tara:strand:- start:1517 stop:1720 length:204 start_codon:yes stop_codon:yes gene_type:complete
MIDVQARYEDSLRKTRELVDQLVCELDKENVPIERLHSLAWDIVNVTRLDEKSNYPYSSLENFVEEG